MKANKWTDSNSGENIRELRDRLNFTNQEFADVVGTGVNRVSNWIRGVNKPSARFWRQFDKLEQDLDLKKPPQESDRIKNIRNQFKHP